jgi:hypothetical protein
VTAHPLDALPLVKAFEAALRASLEPGCRVYLGGAPREAAPPYVVLYPDTGTESDVDRALSDDVPNDLYTQITAVGEGFDQALWAADKANSVMLTTVPSMPGRKVRPTLKDDSQPVRRDDESTGLWYATSQYITRSESA